MTMRWIPILTLVLIMISLPALGPPARADELPIVQKSLSLTQALAIGFERSPVLKKTRADVKMSRAETREAESRLAPALSVNGIVSKQDMPMAVSSAPFIMPSTITLVGKENTADLNAMIMAPLYTGGSLNDRVRAKMLEETASLWEEEKARRDLALAVKVGYLQTLYLENSRVTYEDLLTLQGENVKRQEELYNAGKIPLVYLLRAKNEQASAGSAINTLRASTEKEKSALLSLIGMHPDPSISLEDPLIPWDAPPDRVTLFSSLEDHPLIKKIRGQIGAAQFELSAIQGEYNPQVYLFGMGRVFSPSDMNVNAGYIAGLVASLALSDGGMRKARKEKVIALIEKLEAQVTEARLELETEVVAYSEAMESARRNIDLADASITEATEILRIARLRNNAGKGIYLEILDALWNLAKARLLRLEAVRDYNIAVARLQYVIGN